MSQLTTAESTKSVGPNDTSRSSGQPCVLVVEDNYLLASTLVDVLAELGYTPVDCEGSFKGALAAAETAMYELAVVDLHLNGESAFPILDKLIARDIPYILATHTRRADIPAVYSSAPFICKPYSLEQLRKSIERTLGRHKLNCQHTSKPADQRIESNHGCTTRFTHRSNVRHLPSAPSSHDNLVKVDDGL